MRAGRQNSLLSVALILCLVVVGHALIGGLGRNRRSFARSGVGRPALTVNPAPVPPSINTQPSSQTMTVASAQSQLIALSSNGKYLVNSFTGKPFFLVGDAPQDMDEMLDSAQVTQYLTDRQSRGFNAIWVIITDQFQTNPPYNYYGYKPFDGPDFTNFDANYFGYLDSVVTEAGNDGIIVFLMPFFDGNPAFGPSYEPSLLAASAATMQGYANFLGNRYKSHSNIIWVLGGDAYPDHHGVFSQLNIFGAALAEADSNHLITVEVCDGGCQTSGYNSQQGFIQSGLSVPPWLKLSWVYPSYAGTVQGANIGYTYSPWLPPLCGENYYELEHDWPTSFNEQGVRFEMYTEVLSGCYLGRIYGNGAIWNFNSRTVNNGTPSWQSQLSSPGSVAMSYQGKLFKSREHWLLVPDISHAVVTAGYGSGTTVTTTARTSDGQTIISYIPNGNATTISVNMAEITSSTNTVQGWWFDPSTGATTNLGTFPNSGTQNFTAPDSSDRVLVLDDASANLSAPGAGASPAP